MAAVQALRTALNRLGLSIDAANYATDELGLDTLNRWCDFHTDMDLDGLAKNLRNPGGMIDAPGAVQGAPQIRPIDATTQVTVRSMANPTLSRRFATHDKLLRFRRLPCRMFTDTMKSSVESWFRKNRYGQVYVTDFGWIGFYPMQKKSQAPDTLVELAHDKGVPTHFVMDNSLEQTKGEFKRKARSFGTHIRQLETHSPWQNAAEDGIRELKKAGQ